MEIDYYYGELEEGMKSRVTITTDEQRDSFKMEVKETKPPTKKSLHPLPISLQNPSLSLSHAPDPSTLPLALTRALCLVRTMKSQILVTVRRPDI